MYYGNVRGQRWNEHDFLPRERIDHRLELGMQLDFVTALDAADRNERNAEFARAKLHDDRIAAILPYLHTPGLAGPSVVGSETEVLLETDVRFLHGTHYTASACEIDVKTMGCPDEMEIVPPLPHEFPKQCDRFPHAKAATDGDHVPILDHGGRIVHRHQFVAISENSHVARSAD
jgi:hypothetical protein